MIRSGFLSDFAAQPPKTLSANISIIRFNLIAKKSGNFMLFKSLFHLFKSVLLLLTGIYQPSLYQIFYLFFRYYHNQDQLKAIDDCYLYAMVSARWQGHQYSRLQILL
jgi:hypothetical protein